MVSHSRLPTSTGMAGPLLCQLSCSFATRRSARAYTAAGVGLAPSLCFVRCSLRLLQRRGLQ